MQQTPLAVFSCRTNSHPFQERQISVHEPVKIGRSVARVKASQNNAIFDCRVLSRNHALLWYENSKFYLQDTKSSNGTFVNNQRLSKASEESSPQEISSGDTIQFGVDVMENSRTRVTHSCIIASVQLFHPDGSEARRDFSPFSQLHGGLGVQSQELYQLSQYLQEALHREQMLENKLSTLQRLVDSTQDASESGWQALIDEDRLLSKLEVLQNQLQVYSKNQTEDSLRQELTALQEDKFNYENTAKESLRNVLEEKIEAVRKLTELESSLGNKEGECEHLQQMCESSQKNLEELAEKHQEHLQELANLHEKLQEADKVHKEEMDTINSEKDDLLSKLQDMIKQENILQAKVEALQADSDFSKEQLTNMRARLDSMKETSVDSLLIPELISQGVQVDMVNLLDLQQLHGCSSSTDSDSEKDDNDVEMKDPEAKLVADALADLDFELDSQDADSDDMNEKQLRDSLDELCGLSTSPLPAELADSCSSATITAADHSNQSEQQSGDDDEQAHTAEEFMCTLKPEKLQDTRESIEQYKKLLRESEVKQLESIDKINRLQNELRSVRDECGVYVAKMATLEEAVTHSETHLNAMIDSTQADLKAQLEESEKQKEQNSVLASSLQDQIAELERELLESRGDADAADSQRAPADYGTLKSNSHVTTATLVTSAPDAALTRELNRVTELLDESRSELAVRDDSIRQLQETVAEVQERVVSHEQESESLRVEMSKVTLDVHAKSGRVQLLEDQLTHAEKATINVKEKILALQDHIVEDDKHLKCVSDQSLRLQRESRVWHVHKSCELVWHG